MDVSGKAVVVTGGASGIGKAISEELSQKGCRVVIADFDGGGAKAVADEIGNGAFGIQFDAGDVGSVEAMADKAWSETGGVDIVFANAGVGRGQPLVNATVEAFDWQFDVNVRGVWATCRSFANKMIEADRPGHLIMTGSEHSIGLQHAGMGFYTATKHAVLGLGEVFRKELPETIGISMLCPGLVSTNLSDSGRFGVLPEPDEMERNLGAAIMNKGMPTQELAQKAIAGVERGDFYIVTHAISFPAAEARYQELKEAFESQAPMQEDSSKYHVDNALASVLKEMEN